LIILRFGKRKIRRMTKFKVCNLVDLRFLVGKKKINLKYVEAFKGRKGILKGRRYNVVQFGLFVAKNFNLNYF
jgi:hypothetical protein